MTSREDTFQKAMNAGHSAAWDQNWDKAAEYYRKALDEFQDNPKALSSLGLALVQLQQYEEALKTYQRAAEVAPEDPVPLEKVAQLYERLGNLKSAIQTATQTAEQYIKNQEIDKAIENWLRVTTLDPDNIIAHSRLAMVHEHLNHVSQAVTEYLSVASLLQRSGNPQKASEIVKRAMQLMPNNAEARQAQTFLQSGQLLPKPMRPKGGTGPLRIAQVRQLESHKPVVTSLDPIAEARQKALTRLAGVLFDLSEENKESQTTKRDLQNIVRGTGPLSLKSGELKIIILHLGQAIDAQTKKQEDQAAGELEKALEAGFREPALYFDLGLLRYNGKRLESAFRYLQHAIKQIDYALAARLLMGQIQYQMNHMPEAAIEYLEALKVADSLVVPSDHSEEIRQLYEPYIEAQMQQKDVNKNEQLCKSIQKLLLQPDWRSQVSQAREQLPKTNDGLLPLPLAEILVQAQSSQVIDTVGIVHQLARDGHIRSAMDEAFNALVHAPTYLPLHTLIGDLSLQEGRTQDAIAKYTVIAQAYSVRGETNQAVNLLRRIIQVAPMDLTARTRLIEQLTAKGQNNEAIGEYLDLADIYYRLAELDMARKTYTTALRLAQRGGVNRSWSVKLLQRMADIDMQRLDLRQAMRIYEQIRTLEPNDVSSRKNLIELNIRLNQSSQASAEMDNYIAYLESNGRRGEAIPFLENLIEENPKHALPHRYLADEYRRAKRINDAIAQFDALGEILIDSGDRAGAIQSIEAIIAINPPNIDDYKSVLARIKSAT